MLYQADILLIYVLHRSLSAALRDYSICYSVISQSNLHLRLSQAIHDTLLWIIVYKQQISEQSIINIKLDIKLVAKFFYYFL